MTPQERKLIEGVGQRLRNANVSEKDAEAEALIKQQIEAQPDSTYILTQAVILQEHVLKRAQAQIESLQRKVEQAGQGGGSSADQQAPGASFLGGLFGGGRQQTPSSSGTRASAKSAQRDPWGGAAGSPQAAAPGGGFGGFMRSAATMAVGVAGGALLAGAIQDMFAGEDGQAEQLADESMTDGSEAMPDEPVADAEELSNDFDEFDQDFDTAEAPESDFDFGDDDWA
jgi:hypothetical protein